MWNTPSSHELAAIPRLYSTTSIPARDKVIRMHFFLASYDWYVVEFDGRDTFMGFVAVHGDPASSEWGYFSLSELCAISLNGMEVDRDLHWEPATAGKLGIVTSTA